MTMQRPSTLLYAARHHLRSRRHRRTTDKLRNDLKNAGKYSVLGAEEKTMHFKIFSTIGPLTRSFPPYPRREWASALIYPTISRRTQVSLSLPDGFPSSHEQSDSIPNRSPDKAASSSTLTLRILRVVHNLLRASSPWGGRPTGRFVGCSCEGEFFFVTHIWFLWSSSAFCGRCIPLVGRQQGSTSQYCREINGRGHVLPCDTRGWLQRNIY